MKILLVGNYVLEQQFSMLGFSGVLNRELPGTGDMVCLSSPEAVLARRAGTRVKPVLRKWLGYVDKYAIYPSELRRVIRFWQPDVIHVCDQGNGMYVPHIRHRKHLVTVHDLLAIRTMLGQIPETAIGSSGKVYQKLILKGLQQATNINCVSQATKSDARNVIQTPAAENAPVLYNGLYAPLSALPLADRMSCLERLAVDGTRPFLLHIGGNQFYKNRLGLLQIYSALFDRLQQNTPPLLMVGKPFTPAMREYLAQHRVLQNRVREMSGLDNDAIRALYSQATALVFPSLYEGFGLPVIEAQACGCPVLTSDRAPMTEIGGDAALYLPPAHPQTAAERIASFLADSELQDRMRQAGPFQVRNRFSTDTMVRAYHALYRAIV